MGAAPFPLETDACLAYLEFMPIARLKSRAVVHVTGPDARPFLHNLLTQDVESLNPGELRYGALLSPPGRLLFDLFILGIDDGVLLDVAADRREALIQRLNLYRLRAKVEIAAGDEAVFAAWGDAPSLISDPRLTEMGGRAYGENPEPTASEADYAAHRLALGVPDPATDAPDDKTYPIDANLDLLNGIDFRKGCFIGQETTSRMKRRGAIRNRMLPIAFDGAASAFGAEVLNGDLRAGEVRSGCGDTAMALLRLDRLEGDLTVNGRPASVGSPPWLAAAAAA